jgi:hypothetical protein
MMIQNIQQLNKFANREGVKTVDQLLPKLIESGELVSFSIAKLLTDHGLRESRVFFQPIYERK